MATTEIADILSMVDCIKEANVYGVRVPGADTGNLKIFFPSVPFQIPFQILGFAWQP